MNYLMYFTKQAMSSDPLLSEFVNCIAFQLCFLRVLYDVSRYVKTIISCMQYSIKRYTSWEHNEYEKHLT